MSLIVIMLSMMMMTTKIVTTMMITSMIVKTMTITTTTMMISRPSLNSISEEEHGMQRLLPNHRQQVIIIFTFAYFKKLEERIKTQRIPSQPH